MDSHLTRLGAGTFGQLDNRRLRRAVSRLLGQGCLAAHLAGFQLGVDHPGRKSLGYSIRYSGAVITALTRAWDEITVEQCLTIVGNFRKRLRKCIAVRGGNFEHML